MRMQSIGLSVVSLVGLLICNLPASASPTAAAIGHLDTPAASGSATPSPPMALADIIDSASFRAYLPLVLRQHP